MTVWLRLRHATIVVDHERREVDTQFHDGKVQGAQRAFSQDDIATVRELGYEASEQGVWQSLIAHELLHSLVSDWLWNRPSEVLRHYCAGEPCPVHTRYYVEAIVLAFERLQQTGEFSAALHHLPMHSMPAWRRQLAGLLRLTHPEAVQ